MTTTGVLPPSMAWLTEHLDSLGKRYSLRGTHLAGQCPAHDDRDPSFTADWHPPEPPGKAGRVEVDCKAGCSREALRDAAAAGNWRNLMDGPSELGHSPDGRRRPSPASRRPALARTPRPRSPEPPAAAGDGGHAHRFDYRHAEASHAYTDAAGEVLARVDRVRCADPACPELAAHGKAGKTFVTRHPDGRKGKPRALDGVLYRLPEVLAAVAAGRTVYLCEGEGDADALAAAGECATSAYGGAARAWHPGYTRRLMGAHVLIVADRDPPGYRRAAAVVTALGQVPDSVRVVQAAIDRPGADASDHLAAGLGVADLAPVPPEVYGSTSVHGPEAASGPAVQRPASPQARRTVTTRTGPGPAALAAAGNGDAPPPGPAAPPEPDDGHDDGGQESRGGAPGHRLPSASADLWAYSTGEDADGLSRGVYRRPKNAAGWWWTEELPYVIERVIHRDGAGRRLRMSYRLSARRPDPARPPSPDELTLASTFAVRSGEWAEPLGVPLSANPGVVAAVASAIYREGKRVGVEIEAAPRWTPDGVLEMPPADVGPAGYGTTAGAEVGARHAWAEVAAILSRHGKAAMIAGAAVAAPYLDALPPPRQSFIVHSAGRERRGKTTAHVVSAAVYGDPETIVRPWDISAIGLSALAGEYGCLPPILDELGARRGPRTDLQNIVFQLAQGARRTKGKRDGGSTVTAPWRGIVLSTGNASLLAVLTERGAMARVIEVPTPIIGTDDAADDPAAAADAERLESLAAEWFGWPFAWLRASGITPERFGALLAAARADLDMPAAGAPRTIARHLAACVAGAAALDLALQTACVRLPGGDYAMTARRWPPLRGAALAAAAELLAEMTDRLAEMAAPPGERLAAGVAHAAVSRAEAYPALGELRDPDAPRRYRDGEGFTITEGPDLGMTPAPSLVARWAPPPGLAVGDVGVWCPALPKIAADAGLDDAVTALRELRAAGRLITAGDGAHMRYTVRVRGQKLHAYVFRVADLTSDDGQGGAGDDDTSRARTRPIGDQVGTVGTDQLAAPLPAETDSQPVPTPVGTGQLGGDSAAETAGPAETAPVTSALTGVPAETSLPAETGAPGANAQVTAARQPVPTPVPTAEPYPLGAVLLADAATSYLGDGADLPTPDTLADVLELAAGIGLGAARLHKAARDDGPAVYLTPAACDRFGIPAEPDPDDASGRGRALPEDHPAAAELRAAGWNVRILRTSTQVWRGGPERASITLTLLGWIDDGGLGALLADDPPPASLARRLGRLAALTVAPFWSAAVTAEHMMTAVRPAERRRRDAQTGTLTRTPVPGSLRGPARPSIYDAPDVHPVARDRPPGLACREESMEWARPLDAWTDAERAEPWGVTVDVAAAFLAACSRLPLGLTGPREMTAAEVAAFNADPAAALHIGRGPHRAGVFVAEVSGLREQLDRRLPCPLTPSGQWPDGPLPLHAPTLRYALEYPGVRLAVSAGAVHDECGPYLDRWAARLGDAYAAALADAGITPDMDPAAFLDAYATAAERAPEAWAVLRAVKALYKAGLGRMRHTTGPWRAETHDPGVTCTDDRATWRPDIRAEVIARTRTDMHRKVVKVCTLTGAAPLAWYHDALTYAAPDSSALSVVPLTLDGRQVSGALRIGPRPGWVKFSHAEPMADVLAAVAEGDNPAVRRTPDDDGQDVGAVPGGGE